MDRYSLTNYTSQMLFHDSDNYLNTAATTPVVSPMPMGDRLREKAIFIERSALQDLEEIYQGMSWFEHMAPCIGVDTVYNVEGLDDHCARSARKISALLLKMS